MAMSDEEVQYQALDFLYFYWKTTGDRESKRKFDGGIKKLKVTEAIVSQSRPGREITWCQAVP